MPSDRELKEVARWRARVERGKARRKKNLEEWDENLRFFLHGHGDERMVGEYDHEIIINKVFATLRSQLPSLMFSEPNFYVRPKRAIIQPDMQGGQTDIAPDLARAKQHLLNHYWKELDAQKHIRLAILSSFLAIGCVKVGYTPDFESNPNAGEFALDDSGNLILSGDGLPKLARGDYLRDRDGEVLVDPDSGLPLLEPGELLKNENFFVEWVDWRNMIFDPEGGNEFTTHAWVAEEWVRPTEDVKADPLFKNNKNLAPSEFVDDAMHKEGEMLGVDTDSFRNSNPAVRDDEGRTRGYNIYDFKKRKILTVIDNPPNGAHDFFLREDDMPPEMEHGPFVFLRFNEVPGRWEPLPDVTPMKPLQEELNILRSKLITHISRADRKYLYDENAFESPDELQQLIGGGDMTLVPSNNLDAVQPVPLASVDPAIYQAIPNLDASFDEISGQPAEARGIARADTATQASILENRNNLRESDRRDNIVQSFLREIGRKLLQTMSANMSQGVWVISADPRDPYPFEGFVSPADLEGEADVQITLGSTLPKTSSIERQQFNAVLGLLAQAPFIASSPRMLRRIFEIYEIADMGEAEEIARWAQEMVQRQRRADDVEQAAEAEGSIPESVGGQSNPAGGIPAGVLNGRGTVQ